MAEEFNEVDELEDEDIVTLIDNDGVEREFQTVATFPFKDKWYTILEPTELFDGIEEGEVVIYRIEGEEGEEILVNIEDENEADEVFGEFMKLMEEAEDECGCGCGEHHHCDCGCDCDDCE